MERRGVFVPLFVVVVVDEVLSQAPSEDFRDRNPVSLRGRVRLIVLARRHEHIHPSGRVLAIPDRRAARALRLRHRRAAGEQGDI